MSPFQRTIRRLAFLAPVLFLPAVLHAQSVVSGSISGLVTVAEGDPLPEARLELAGPEALGTEVFYTRRDGEFGFAVVAPGTYTLLAEAAGYQPVRQHGIMVRAGEQIRVTITLERRPPPVETVEDRTVEPGIVSSFLGQGEDAPAWVRRFDRRRAVTDLGRDLNTFAQSGDGREGLALMSGGLPAGFSRLYVDGVEEFLIRHPGLPGEPASAPVFSRSSLGAALALDDANDGEWMGTGGGLLSVTTRRGSEGARFSPWMSFGSSGLGGRSEDNPADSSATSLQGGAVVRGRLAGGAGRYLAGGEYQSLETPGAAPWGDDATFNGGPVPLASTLTALAADSFGVNAGVYTVPTLRSWRGGNGFGRLDYRLAPRHILMARAAYATWKEQNPLLGASLASGVGSRLEASDASAMVALTSTPGEVTNEFRAGLRRAHRDWIASSLPETRFAAEGAAMGIAATLPADFTTRVFHFSDAVQVRLGERHRLKLGALGEFVRWEQDYLYAGAGVFTFGDLDRFAQGIGAFYQARDTAGAVSFSSKNAAAFLEDTWRPTDRLEVRAGVRFEAQALPKTAIGLDQGWTTATGFVPLLQVRDRNDFAPVGSFAWTSARGDWRVEGGGGWFYHGMDLALFSEAIQYDGGVRVRRAVGNLSAWPAVDTAAVPFAERRLTLFKDSYQNPRTAKLSLGISRLLRGATIGVTGHYFHTDYLPRRTDLNLAAGVTGATQEGRAVYGTLVKQGGGIVVQPGSNRLVSGYDMVLGVAPTGFADYYGVTLSLSRPVAEGLSLEASYTYSRTTDNTPLAVSGDPADLLSPFPGQPSSQDWQDGRSDLDIPHRATVALEYRVPSSLDVTLGARYRFRSGLPFTPGFRDGVDVNGDGSGRNDPVFVDPTLPGVPELVSANACLGDQAGQFVERNSCRDPARHALDLRVVIGLGVRSLGAPLYLTVDAFNVVATASGLRDHAALLVDPGQPIVNDGNGNLVIPFTGNPAFGTIQSRRGGDRLIRIGLRVGE